jgi:serine/threonine protein kinase
MSVHKDMTVEGRYRIEGQLAAGGFGAIYRATDATTGRPVALKVLHPELATDPCVVERFRREAAALARLRDPHTVTMYDVGEAADGTPFLVLELLAGQTVLDVMRAHGPLPWRRAAAIARGVCSSLREAHALGIVHRDLKPANLHVQPHPLGGDHVKVLDFGIAKLVDAAEPDAPDLTITGEMVGTFDYMAPEQMLGRATAKSDVFTLGVVVYEMIAGVLPFGPTTGPAGQLMALLHELPARLGARAMVPAALDRLVMRCLAPDPDDRPDVAELDDALARLLIEDDIAACTAWTDAEDEITWIGAAPRVPANPRTCPGVGPAPELARGSAPVVADERSESAGGGGHDEPQLAADPAWLAPYVARHAPPPPSPRMRLATGTAPDAAPLPATQELPPPAPAIGTPPRFALRVLAWSLALVTLGLATGAVLALAAT